VHTYIHIDLWQPKAGLDEHT